MGPRYNIVTVVVPLKWPATICAVRETMIIPNYSNSFQEIAWESEHMRVVQSARHFQAMQEIFWAKAKAPFLISHRWVLRKVVRSFTHYFSQNPSMRN